MKRVILFCNIMILLAHQALSNNVQVSNVRLTNQNTTDDFTMVEFDITWENSWRYSSGPANWDAAWIFVKFKVGSGGNWQHAWLNNTGHVVCGNSTLTNGYLSPELPYNSITNPSLGVFLYRTNPGTGAFSCTDVQLRWNYGQNSVTDNAQVDIRVFAIEMVYVPQGDFYVGSGGTETGAFYTYPNPNTPFLISSEAAINVGAQNGYLYYPSVANAGDQGGPIPAAFPKGFKAYYAMKYEITQQAYADFLNTLTRQQQQTRVDSDITGTSTPIRYVMAESSVPLYRSYIKCTATIPPAPGQVFFYCDYNNNEIGGQEGDGQNVACNYLSINDVGAYLDWSALRFMTEFEYEKCGRGSQVPVPNEFAWGNTNAYLHTGLTNFSTSNELPTGTISNISSDASTGPLRVGLFARSNSDRALAGAGYYGCMELSGNLYERGVTTGNPNGRAYEGKHGNGTLDPAGNHNVDTWPSLGGSGGFLRGGYWSVFVLRACISNREEAANSNNTRYEIFGGRGVRSE